MYICQRWVWFFRLAFINISGISIILTLLISLTWAKFKHDVVNKIYCIYMVVYDVSSYLVIKCTIVNISSLKRETYASV